MGSTIEGTVINGRNNVKYHRLLLTLFCSSPVFMSGFCLFCACTSTIIISNCDQKCLLMLVPGVAFSNLFMISYKIHNCSAAHLFHTCPINISLCHCEPERLECCAWCLQNYVSRSISPSRFVVFTYHLL